MLTLNGLRITPPPRWATLRHLVHAVAVAGKKIFCHPVVRIDWRKAAFLKHW
jgi:hypothetical protein